MTDAAPAVDGAGFSPLTISIEGDPEFAALAVHFPERYPFLLQSTARDPALGRYEILFAFPRDEFSNDDTSGFLDALDQSWRREGQPAGHPGIPFSGGWFLFLGYELAKEIEAGLTLGRDRLLPQAFAVRCPAALIRDLDSGTVTLVAEPHSGIDPAAVIADIRSIADMPGADTPGHARIQEEEPTRFIEAVEAAKQYIEKGDIYQANLSREWRVETDRPLDAWALFRSLATANPAPFAGLVHWQGTWVVSSSPERLIEVRDGVVNTRPIAGTRPRSDDAAKDRQLLEELIAHPKERAEHVMLIDLERNDLGRVCEAGTVDVSEMMVIESYAHVHHIVSNVRGRLRPDVTPGQVIAAVFPGGTITGCPKVRCMAIIDELEDSPRGAYTGSIGYLNLDGSMDLNILIRTVVANGNVATFRAGSGIVADSEAEAELEETRAKAKGLLRAFGL